MLTFKKIAVTGGIASGKSSVCRVFQELGAFVINADTIVHELLVPTTDIGREVVRLLGEEILDNGVLNRRLIAKRVFNEPDTLHALEQLLHPAVRRELENRYQKALQERTTRRWKAFVVEVPLLYEAGDDPFYDIIVTVVADEKLCRERFRKSGFDQGEYERRMSRQLPPAEKARRAHYVIYNNESLEFLHKQVVELGKNLLN